MIRSQNWIFFKRTAHKLLFVIKLLPLFRKKNGINVNVCFSVGQLFMAAKFDQYQN